MTPSETLKTAMYRSDMRVVDLARALGVSRAAAARALGRAHPYADSLARYLEAAGYTLWAVPSSLHLDAITSDAMRIDVATAPAKD